MIGLKLKIYILIVMEFEINQNFLETLNRPLFLEFILSKKYNNNNSHKFLL
jgi:hypothetical protein